MRRKGNDLWLPPGWPAQVSYCTEPPIDCVEAADDLPLPPPYPGEFDNLCLTWIKAGVQTLQQAWARSGKKQRCPDTFDWCEFPDGAN